MNNIRVRRLTERECWRLMGFSDSDFDKAKQALIVEQYGGKDRCSSQMYKQAGNSIVVDVLEAIMAELYDAMPYLFDDIKVGSFFSGIGAFEAALSRFDGNNKRNKEKPDKDEGLNQIGFIGKDNQSNRIYDSSMARTLAAEAGGGGC